MPCSTNGLVLFRSELTFVWVAKEVLAMTLKTKNYKNNKPTFSLTYINCKSSNHFLDVYFSWWVCNVFQMINQHFHAIMHHWMHCSKFSRSKSRTRMLFVIDKSLKSYKTYLTIVRILFQASPPDMNKFKFHMSSQVPWVGLSINKWKSLIIICLINSASLTTSTFLKAEATPYTFPQRSNWSLV